jgi:hypothetical protein
MAVERRRRNAFICATTDNLFTLLHAEIELIASSSREVLILLEEKCSGEMPHRCKAKKLEHEAHHTGTGVPFLQELATC